MEGEPFHVVPADYARGAFQFGGRHGLRIRHLPASSIDAAVPALQRAALRFHEVAAAIGRDLQPAARQPLH